MNRPCDARRKFRVGVFKALAHPSRLLIIEELAKSDKCVCELTRMVGAEMPTVSRHLSVLKNAGIVEDDKRGMQVFYRLAAPCVLKFLDCVDGVGKSKGNSRKCL